MRVERIFNQSIATGVWSDRPVHMTACLIFVTVSSNIRKDGVRYLMLNSPKKHIGIFINGTIWHYSNSQNKVVADPEKIFIGKFARAYRTAGNTVNFYYGAFLP